MTEQQFLEALVVVIALTLSAAVVTAVTTARSMGDRIARGLAVCAEIALILFLAWPSCR